MGNGGMLAAATRRPKDSLISRVGLAVLDGVRDQLLNRDSSQVANKASLVSPFFWAGIRFARDWSRWSGSDAFENLLHMRLPLEDCGIALESGISMHPGLPPDEIME